MTNFKKAASEVEGVLLIATNVALAVLPAATTMPVATSAKFGAVLNGIAYFANKLQQGLESKAAQDLTGITPEQLLSAQHQQELNQSAEAIVAAAGKAFPPGVSQ